MSHFDESIFAAYLLLLRNSFLKWSVPLCGYDMVATLGVTCGIDFLPPHQFERTPANAKLVSTGASALSSRPFTAATACDAKNIYAYLPCT